eukprot:CAMPEP_0180638992 /NCGR_PEP_ID=MMETSP1037_2-20121125/44695_1 /TAXON_ID=632150 /ORGANISM="Azadinium spinosum, Strain 3D9" /LENGTH=78 /DNA_ID=CAMNT_0022660707 /DNA_START=25 /DNA_END=258 /DNA_ORIENTATION=-
MSRGEDYNPGVGGAFSVVLEMFDLDSCMRTLKEARIRVFEVGHLKEGSSEAAESAESMIGTALVQEPKDYTRYLGENV